MLSQELAVWRTAESDVRVTRAANVLQTDQWRQRPAWTPLHRDDRLAGGASRGASRQNRARWMHPSGELAAELIAAPTGPTADVIEPDATDGRTADGAARKPPQVDDLNARYAQLVLQDQMPGWNGAILWAEHDPQAAQPAAVVLAKLTLHPPEYTPRQTEPPAATIASPRKAREAKPAAPAPTRISTNMRAAAAAAWCAVLAESSADPDTAMAPAGIALLDKDLPELIRAELMRGIACRVPPVRIPGVAGALRTENAGDTDPVASLELRRAAMDACLLHAVVHRESLSHPADAARPDSSTDQGNGAGADGQASDAEIDGTPSPWPGEVWNRQWDPDFRVRQRFGEWLAVLAHPNAFKVLKAQLTDQEPKVRDAALFSLGLLATPEALAELRAQGQRNEIPIRRSALRGLALHGEQAISEFVHDKSASVRSETARSLRAFPTAAAARLIRPLLADASLDVQSSAIGAIAEWPDEIAIPLLLQSLAESSIKTRTLALPQLERRRGTQLIFPLDGNPEERVRQVEAWGAAWNLPDPLAAIAGDSAKPAASRIDALRLAEIQEQLRQLWTPGAASPEPAVEQWLQRLTVADLPMVERILDSAAPPQRAYLLETVLPRLSPAYAALQQLGEGDLNIRRRGAQALGDLGNEVSLSPVIVRTLRTRLQHEQDMLVWRYVMRAVQQDASDEAAQLALLAVNHTWPDIRVLGCDYIAWHGRSPHAIWLLPLLYDQNRTVQLAAVTAAGKCRNPIALDGLPVADGQGGPKGLRPLLREPRGPLHFAVVVSMSRIGDAQAMDELIRLSFDASPTVQTDIVRAMGETGQTRFVEPLIRLAWTEKHYNVKSAAAMALRQLVPADEHPAGLKEAQTLEQMVLLWVSWWESRVR